MSQPSSTPRADGRTADQLRPVTITRNWLDHAEGSVLVEFGQHPGAVRGERHRGRAALAQGLGPRAGSPPSTRCCRAPPTPAATASRSRAGSAAAPTRSAGSSAARCAPRSTWRALGENSIAIDCDVLQADGGTRTAAITGAYVALADAVSWLGDRKKLAKTEPPSSQSVAAVSVGVIDGEPRLDLAYEEDVRAGTDMNVVCTGDGSFVEVQGTAEGAVFDRPTLDALLDLAVTGCAELTRMQAAALAR